MTTTHVSVAGPARASASGTRVRPFAPSDLPRLVELHRKAFPDGRLGAAELAAHLSSMLCEHPWLDPDCPSLVCQDEAGRVVGALGVMPRPMIFLGRRIRMAVSHNFMVDPESRSSLAALRLLQAFLDLPHHLSIAESNSQGRRLWASLHGATAYAYSLRWIRPLSPARYAASMWTRADRSSATARMLTQMAGIADGVAARSARNPFAVATTGTSAETLDVDTLATGLRTVSAPCALRPAYDTASLQWLLDTLESRRTSGAFHRVAIRNRRGDLVGWYLYFLRPGGTGEVVQLAGRRESLEDVFDHLLAHASARGAVALTGRVDPALLPVCAAKHCVFRGDPWMLVHSADPDIADAIHRGEAFLTPLEGEGWIGS